MWVVLKPSSCHLTCDAEICSLVDMWPKCVMSQSLAVYASMDLKVDQALMLDGAEALTFHEAYVHLLNLSCYEASPHMQEWSACKDRKCAKKSTLE